MSINESEMFDGVIFKSDGLMYNVLIGSWYNISEFPKIDIASINFYGGIGTGAILAILCSLEYNHYNIHELFSDFHKKLIANKNTLISKLMCNKIRKTISFDHVLIEYIEDLIYKKINKTHVTFKDLYMLNNKYLRLIGCNLTTKSIQKMDFYNTPSMYVIDALKICLCDPLLNEPITIDNNLYINNSIVLTSSYTMFMDISNKKFLLINIRDKQKLKNSKRTVKEDIIAALQNLKSDFCIPSNVEVLSIDAKCGADETNILAITDVNEKSFMYLFNCGHFHTNSFLDLKCLKSPKSPKNELGRSMEEMKRGSADLNKLTNMKRLSLEINKFIQLQAIQLQAIKN